MAVLQGRHPILDRSTTISLTPNSTFLSQQTSGMVITGSNMGGKTTYLLQVALLQILAQIGSFVPAEFATFKIVDQILVRFGSTSSNETNGSTFANEMIESSFILQNATASSLVLMDELCRSTSREEGAPLAFSILESLRKSGCYLIVATHEPLMTKLAEMYPDISNYHMETEEVEARDGTTALRHTHRLVPGVLLVTEYGLRLAASSGLPNSVMGEAWATAARLANQDKTPAHVATECLVQKLKTAFITRLSLMSRQVTSGRISEVEGFNEFEKLKAELVCSVSRIASAPDTN